MATGAGGALDGAGSRSVASVFFGGRRLLMTIAVLVGAAALCGLGVWQWGRHVQRAALNERIVSRMAAEPVSLGPQLTAAEADSLDYRRVTVTGTYDDSQAVLLRNRSYDGTTGYHLIVPLRIAGGGGAAVLVDRGWVPLGASDPAARQAFAQPGEVTVSGVARAGQPYAGGPADPPLTAARPRLDAWFRVDIGRIQQQVGYPLLPVFVEVQPGAAPPAAPPFPSATTDLGLGPHLGYAFQWFSFAAILVGGYAALMLRGRARAGRAGEGGERRSAR